jgi:hypothetical protein
MLSDPTVLSFSLPIVGNPRIAPGQKAECLEYSPDMVGQSRGHADEWRPCTEKSTRAVERLDMNRPVPPGANDLSQSLRIVLISLGSAS